MWVMKKIYIQNLRFITMYFQRFHGQLSPKVSHRHSCSPGSWKQLQPLLRNKINMLFLLASHSNQHLETDEKHKPQQSFKKKATNNPVF